MKTVKLALVSMLTLLVFAGIELVHVPSAHAVVGRPLTPVSVAGVARRTSRRNAYYGQLSPARSTDRASQKPVTSTGTRLVVPELPSPS